MQKKIKIAIDVDLCLTSSVDYYWYDYLLDNYFQYLTYENYNRFVTEYNNSVCEYNLTKYFNLPENINPMEYWEQDDLYDEETLQEGAYEVIKNLYEANFDIYFLSYCNFTHIDSKYKFLKRSFDFMSDEIKFVATKDKCAMDGSADIVIDDRISNLNSFTDDKTLRILRNTPYKQDGEAKVDHHVCDTWRDIENIICEWLEVHNEN